MPVSPINPETARVASKTDAQASAYAQRVRTSGIALRAHAPPCGCTVEDIEAGRGCPTVEVKTVSA